MPKVYMQSTLGPALQNAPLAKDRPNPQRLISVQEGAQVTRLWRNLCFNLETRQWETSEELVNDSSQLSLL